MRVLCPRCEIEFGVPDGEAGAPVECPSCGRRLGRVGDASGAPECPIPLEPFVTLEAHGSPVWSLAVAPTGGLFASGAVDGSVKLWTASDGRERSSLPPHPKAVTALAFSHDGRWLASADMDGLLRLWDCWEHAERPELSGYVDGTLAFAPDGETLATGAPPHHVRMWDVVRGRDRLLLDVEHPDVKAVAFARDGVTLATGHLREAGVSVQSWSWATRARRAAWTEPAFVSAVSFSPDGATLAAASLTGRVCLWDVGSGSPRGTWTPLGRGRYFEPPPVMSISFSPDGTFLAGALHTDTGPNLQVWEPATGRLRVALKAHSDRVQRVAFLPDGSGLITASRDRTVKLWRMGGR